VLTHTLCQFRGKSAFLYLQSDLTSFLGGQPIVQIGQQSSESQSHGILLPPVLKTTRTRLPAGIPENSAAHRMKPYKKMVRIRISAGNAADFPDLQQRKPENRQF